MAKKRWRVTFRQTLVRDAERVIRAATYEEVEREAERLADSIAGVALRWGPARTIGDVTVDEILQEDLP